MDPKEELKKKAQNEDTDALELVLQHVGEWGRYQKLLFLAMMPFGFFFAFVYFVQMFVAATPQSHWCRVPELEHLDQELRRNLSAPLGAEDWEWERCQTYDVNWTHVSLTLTPPHPNTSKVQCNSGWEFQLGDIPYHTVVSERGWVCDYAGYAPIAQSIFFAGSFVGGLLFGWLADRFGRVPALVGFNKSIFFAGSFVGGLLFGWLADRFGRVPALVGANLIGCVGGVLTIFTSGLWDFAICRFLVGMSYDSCFILMYILVLEYVGPSHRTWIANMSIAIYFGGGCLALPWIALWISNWKILLLATSLPMMIVLAAIFVVPESARWLSSQGKVNKAVEILRKFERVNRTKIPEDVMDDFIVQARQTRHTDESIGALMKSSQLRLMMLFMVIVYMACAIIFDGLVRMSENLGFDFFITFTLTSATEIPSVTLLAFVLDKWGRRNLTVGPLWIAGTLSLIAAFVPKGIPQVALAIMARFCINMAYNTIIQWATELLPTPVRASGSSVVHVSGYIGTVLSPYIVFSERIWRPLPLLTLGIIAMLSGGIAIFLPESMGRNLPQNIVEGERLFNEYSMCGKPERDDVEVEEMKSEKEKALIT
ncbi:sugar transporter domain-containing protein [Phthorimaea operculella]|nr:sugar transporter domain-containing protein [Phthorimaea operculella]